MVAINVLFSLIFKILQLLTGYCQLTQVLLNLCNGHKIVHLQHLVYLIILLI